MHLALIDIGSNAIRLVIYDWDGKQLSVAEKLKRRTDSARYIVQNKISRFGLESIAQVVKELLVVARTYDVEDIRVFASASLRNIDNSEEAIHRLEEMCRIKIELLDERKEGEFGFEGMRRTAQLPLEGLCVDIGAVATELSYFKYDKLIYTSSIPTGSLNLYLNHVQEVLPSDSERFFIRYELGKYLDSVTWLKSINCENIIGIGGSSRAIMRYHQARYAINASIYDMHLSAERIHEIAELKFNSEDNELFLALKSIQNRITTLVPAAIMMDEIMSRVQAKDYALSSSGVREGYVYGRILELKE